MYLLLAVNIDNVLLKFASIKRYWFDEKKVVKIVNYILDTNNALPFPKLFGNFFLQHCARLLVTSACLVYTGMAVVHWLTGSLYFVTSANTTGISILTWNSTLWWHQMMDEGRFTFCLDKKNSITGMEVAAGILAALGYLWRLVLGANEELLLLIATFTLWISAKQFQTRLEMENGAKIWTQIFMEYKAIKKLASMINDVFGSTMFYVVIETALFNCMNIDDIFLNDSGFDLTKVFSFTMYSVITCVIFLISADVSKKVN